MEKLTRKKDINFLAFLFAFTYMVSYITRINYGAIIVEMVEATGFSKSALSMAVTGSFITYGVGQIISGIIGDRISPKMFAIKKGFGPWSTYVFIIVTILIIPMLYFGRVAVIDDIPYTTHTHALMLIPCTGSK